MNISPLDYLTLTAEQQAYLTQLAMKPVLPGPDVDRGAYHNALVWAIFYRLFHGQAIEDVAEDLCGVKNYVDAKALLMWGSAQIPPDVVEGAA
jgi:hypothetical protein